MISIFFATKSFMRINDIYTKYSLVSFVSRLEIFRGERAEAGEGVIAGEGLVDKFGFESRAANNNNHYNHNYYSTIWIRFRS